MNILKYIWNAYVKHKKKIKELYYMIEFIIVDRKKFVLNFLIQILFIIIQCQREIRNFYKLF